MGHHHGARHTPVHTCGGDTAAATDHLARARGDTATGDTATGDTGGADLLHRAQRGDRLAFEHLYRRYVGNVQRYVIVRMRDWDRDAVPDLVQDTFCIALAELHAADPDVLGWLIGLAAKACTRHQWALRRYLRAALTVGEVAERAATQQPPASGNPAGAPGRAPFAHALARLAPEERRAVQLRYLDGLARSMTAQLMGTTAHTVRTLERRALHQLRLSLTATDPAGAEAPISPARPAARGARR